MNQGDLSGSSETAVVSTVEQRDRSTSVDRFIAVIGEVIGLAEVTRTEHFLDLGGDSLDAVIVTDMISQEFGTAPELDWFFESATVQELADSWWRVMSADAVRAAGPGD
jgi:iturin family lipopeptide synthetase A